MSVHSVERRKVTRRADEMWVGSVACSCGWIVEIGPYGAREVVTEGLTADWEAHSTEEQAAAV